MINNIVVTGSIRIGCRASVATFCILLAFTFCINLPLLAQELSVSGKVFTSNGEPVPGVTVTLKGTTLKTRTDKNGYYKIGLTGGGEGSTLVFERDGMTPQEREINEKSVVNVTTSETVDQSPPGQEFVPTESWRALRKAELTDPDVLYNRGESRIYTGQYLDAIRLPVGGVGTGAIHMDGTGRRAAWQLWRNFEDFELPNSIFAVRAQVDQGDPVVRALQTVSAGPFAAMKSVSFKGEYPFGWYYFDDPDLPVKVSMEAFNPLIPLDAKNSAIPCAIYNLTVRNDGDTPVNISFLATQQNASGMVETLPPFNYDSITRRIYRKPPNGSTVNGRKSDQYGGNKNEVIRTGKETMIYMTGKGQKNSPAYGEMALSVLDKDALAAANFSDFAALYKEFESTGKVTGVSTAGPSPNGETVEGAIATPFVLGPGKERTISFVLTWYFPNIPMYADENCPNWKHHGYIYKEWWSDGLDLTKDVLKRFDYLSGTSKRYHDSFYETNMPYWMLDRITSQAAVLSSATAFWANDNHFGVWEGTSYTFGSCAGNATHVWGYAHIVPRLFPSIGKKMREQEHAEQTSEGMLPVRLGMTRPFQAYDGQCHSILGSYLIHLLSPDDAWLKKQWPKIKESMDYLIQGWDSDEDGMLSGAQHGMDSKHGGTSSWMGSMYMAALAASEKMATLRGDSKSASRYARILEVGAKIQDEKLFNGEYYIQIPDVVPHKDYLTGCYTDQMLGQWWLNLLDLGWVYPKEHVRSAMNSLFKYNFKTDFYNFKQSPRKFVLDNEPAMVQTTWPSGGRPEPEFTMLHADEVKVGISYPVAALMMYAGMTTEAFSIVYANYGRYDGRLRTDLTNGSFTSLGFSGNPFGDDCAGKFYVRSLSTWSLLIAAQGQIFDGPKGILGFDPKWQPNDHVSFFTAAEGWGRFSQTRNGAQQQDKIQLDWGGLKLQQLVFAVQPGATVTKTELKLNGVKIGASHKQVGQRVFIDLAKSVNLKAGQSLQVIIDCKE